MSIKVYDTAQTGPEMMGRIRIEGEKPLLLIGWDKKTGVKLEPANISAMELDLPRDSLRHLHERLGLYLSGNFATACGDIELIEADRPD
jgi:hypothetical protein